MMRQEEAGCARLGAPAQPVPAVERHREAALHSSTSGWWFWQAGWYFPSGGMAGDTQNTVSWESVGMWKLAWVFSHVKWVHRNIPGSFIEQLES